MAENNSDYHLDSMFEDCKSSLVAPNSTYFVTHPALYGDPDETGSGDLTPLRYAYVKIAYICSSYLHEESLYGQAYKYGWAIKSDVSYPIPTQKPPVKAKVPSHFWFTDSACAYFKYKSWYTPTLASTYGKSLFTDGGDNLLGATLVYTTRPFHDNNNTITPRWVTIGDNSNCPKPNNDGSTEDSVVVYTSPLVDIRDLLKRFPTYHELMRVWLLQHQGKGDRGYLDTRIPTKKIAELASKLTYRLRKALYDRLVPCHTCEGAIDGQEVAMNSCVPCVCRPSVKEVCDKYGKFEADRVTPKYEEKDPEELEGDDTTGSESHLEVGSLSDPTKPLGIASGDYATFLHWTLDADQANDTGYRCGEPEIITKPDGIKCLKCKPTDIKDANGNTVSVFCPEGEICKKIEVVKYDNSKELKKDTCGVADSLVPVFHSSCVKAADVKKLVLEVNKVVEEAQKFQNAYLSRSPDGLLTWNVPNSKRKKVKLKYRRAGGGYLNKKWVKKTKKVKIELKKLEIVCPEPVEDKTKEIKLVKIKSWIPLEFETEVAKLITYKLPDYCNEELSEKWLLDDPKICICEKKGFCMDQKNMFALLTKISVTLEKTLMSMGIPWKLKFFDDKKDPELKDTKDKNKPLAGCRTTFPIACPCIQPPLESWDRKHKKYPDNDIFKCRSKPRKWTEAEGVNLDDYSDISFKYPVDSCWVAEDSSKATATQKWVPSSKVGKPEEVGYEVYDIGYYKRGWLMMGQITMSDFIEKYFGTSWNPVPSCCNGGDCLGQWHFELLWRVTQALLYGNFSQPQGQKAGTSVAYYLGKCMKQECPPRFAKKLIDSIEYYQPPVLAIDRWPVSDGKVYTGPNAPSGNDSVVSVAGRYMEGENLIDTLNIAGSIMTPGDRYWLRNTAHPYNKVYSNINIPAEIDTLVYLDPIKLNNKYSYTLTHSVTQDVNLLTQAKLLILKDYFKRFAKWNTVLIEECRQLIKTTENLLDLDFKLLSLVTDGYYSTEELTKILELIDYCPRPRFYTLLLEEERLKGKAEEENSRIMLGLDIQRTSKDYNKLEDKAIGVSEDLSSDSLLNVEDVYELREVLAELNTDFKLIVEDLKNNISTGCTECRLTRLKRELFREVQKLFTKGDIKTRAKLLEVLQAVKPTKTKLRIIENFKVKDALITNLTR